MSRKSDDEWSDAGQFIAHIPITQARRQLGQVIQIAKTGTDVVLARRARPAAVLITVRRYEDLLEQSGDEATALTYLLQTVFPRLADRNQWLKSAVPALEGQSPAELLAAGRGKEVLQVMVNLRVGIFS